MKWTLTRVGVKLALERFARVCDTLERRPEPTIME